MGTTVLAAYCHENELYVINLGDSRAVLFNQNDASSITSITPYLLTSDHRTNVIEEKARILSIGGKIENGRVNGRLAVTRALGDSSLSPYISCIPDIKVVSMSQKDQFIVLASDGLWGVFTNNHTDTLEHRSLLHQKNLPAWNEGMEVVEEIVMKSATPTEAAENLCQLARDKGSEDNIAIIVIFLNFHGLNSKPSVGPRLLQPAQIIASTQNQELRYFSEETFAGIHSPQEKALVNTEEQVQQLTQLLHTLADTKDLDLTLTTASNAVAASIAHSNPSPRDIQAAYSQPNLDTKKIIALDSPRKLQPSTSLTSLRQPTKSTLSPTPSTAAFFTPHTTIQLSSTSVTSLKKLKSSLSMDLSTKRASKLESDSRALHPMCAHTTSASALPLTTPTAPSATPIGTNVTIATNNATSPIQSPTIGASETRAINTRTIAVASTPVSTLYSPTTAPQTKPVPIPPSQSGGGKESTIPRQVAPSEGIGLLLPVGNRTSIADEFVTEMWQWLNTQSIFGK